MKKIAITGGKGGTGKSTVAILLANKLRKKGKKVVLVDADVECPNDYLLLGEKLARPVAQVYGQFPRLDKEKCRRCGLCASSCRANAIFQPPGQFPVFLEELCSGCGLCWHICPAGAIKPAKKLIGEVFKNRIGENFYLVTGRSKGVVDESGPIVSRARQYGLKLAASLKADYLLIDTAVGLHCGVIRALLGADLAYAVTEPTPLGAHDLDLILQLLQQLKVPAEIILNQADLGKAELIEAISRKRKVALSQRISYSRKLVDLYCRGRLGEMDIL